jgi:nucleotide-binding universal stress UspA family protein
MKVLFCTDGSKISYNSIINLSKWVKDLSVDILCVADWSFLPDSIAVEDKDFVLKCTNSAKSIISYSEKLLKQNNIMVNDKFSMCGSITDCILEACELGNYEVVLLGSNGKKGVQKWLGSVSQEVSSASKISTYIAKFENSAKKILFAIDYSELTSNIVDIAIEILNLKDKEVYFATVYETPDYLFLEGNIDSNWIKDTKIKQENSANILLNKYEKIFKQCNINIKKKFVLSGKPASEIINLANNKNIDLVVCGARKRKSYAKFLLSSFSKRILENSKSDVFIIRPNNYQ